MCGLRAQTLSRGETAFFCGKVHFHKSMRYLKWQKYKNDRYINIDHDVHKEKYKRSKNYFKNSNLKGHKVNAEDEVKHRLEVKTKSFTIYSFTVTLKLFSVSCKFINIILIFGGCTTSFGIYSVQL